MANQQVLKEHVLENQLSFDNTIDLVLSEAKKLGVQEAEASLSNGDGLAVTIRMGELDKVEYERDKGLTLTLFLDGRKGNVSTTDFSKSALKESVKAAYHIACHTGIDTCTGLAPADLMATEILDLDLSYPWDLSSDQAITLAIECERQAREVDVRICNADGTVVSHYLGHYLYANTHGFCAGWGASSHLIDCALVAQDKNGMQRDGWYSKACDPGDLQTIESIADEASRRTVAKLGARGLSTRKVPVIFEAPVASGLFSELVNAVSGGNLYRKASFLLDKLGEQIFAKHIHIHEAPHLKKGLGSAPFDNDGVSTQAKDIIKAGVLQTYLLSHYTACKLGLQTTGNAGGVHNLMVSPTAHQYDFPNLLREMGSGVLITEIIGFGINQVTGDYSRGASGFWVEQGEIMHPVEGITVAGNLLDMYQHIVAIGSDLDTRGNIITGSVLIDGLTIAGTS